MISLEQVHREMNSKIIRDIASIAFNKWLSSHLENRAKLKPFINSAFRSVPTAPTIHKKLAVEVLLMIKLDNLMKEVTNLTGEQSLGQMRYMQ